jgi:hypothetical protein
MGKNLLLVAVSFAIALALAEAALRLAAPHLGRPYEPLLFTTHAPHLDEAGALRFAPHQSMRMVVLFSDEIEVDVRFGTNNVGLFDHQDYVPGPAARRRHAFVGDSYAAGVEGDRPWIPALRDRTGIEAHALGVGATGMLAFEKMLRSHLAKFPSSDVVIVAISDDFLRPLWRPLAASDEFRMCRETESDSTCLQRPPIARLMQLETPAAELVAKARGFMERRESERSALRSVLRQSRVLMLARNAQRQWMLREDRSAVFEESVAALRRVRLAYPEARIRFVHVPDRSETARGAYDLDLRAPVEAVGIEYLPVLGTCPWSIRNYYPRDNHPNPSGYEALGQCVGAMLGLESAGR